MELCVENTCLYGVNSVLESNDKHAHIHEDQNNDAENIETNLLNKNDNPNNVTNESNEENKSKNKNSDDFKNIKYSDDEKETKDDANEKYNKGDYQGALKIWERGLRTINYILSKKEELKSERLQNFQKLHSTYCSNIAQGYMKLNKYSECVKYSLLAKENDKNNIKISYRLAKGYYMLGEYDKSINVLNETIKIKNDEVLNNLLVIVKKKKQVHLEKEKCMMKYIFQNLKENPLTSDEENKTSFFKNIIYKIYSFLCFLLTCISIFYKNCSNLFYFPTKRCEVKKE